MTSKKLWKALGIGVTVGVVAEKAWRQICNKMYVWEGERAFRALERLAEANNLSIEAFTYVSDSGTVPIYTYDAKAINLEELMMPEGYILHKMLHPSGSVNYILGKDSVRKLTTTYYSAYLYLDDIAEWEGDDNIEAEENQDDLE